jgi:hypothetical protein
MKSIAAMTSTMTIVRMNVAILEFRPVTPSLPNTAVSAAKNAEPNAKTTHPGPVFIHAPGEKK